RGVICPFFTSDSRTEYFIPGAAGFRDCRTYHGPRRALVAWRVRGVFSIVQRAQAPSAPWLSVPQNGQTTLPRSCCWTCCAGVGSSAKDSNPVGESTVRLMIAFR